ncbi:NAD(P)-binding protein [Meredithblackwellia eburnea MCA 4105]
MSSQTKTVYLISGANRGIGFGLATTLATRPNVVVFAGTRDPANSTALQKLAKEKENVHVVKLTSGDEKDNKAAVEEIEKVAGQLDVVIANAGISKYYGPILTHPLSEFTDHVSINTIAPVVLFQSSWPLLSRTPSKAPQFHVISSAAGSIGAYFHLGAAAYGASKAAVNFVIKVIHTEHEKEGVIATAINPSWVQTDMGNLGATSNGMAEAPVTLQESVDGILGLIEGSTREKSGGKFLNAVPGDQNPWEINSVELVW